MSAARRILSILLLTAFFGMAHAAVPIPSPLTGPVTPGTWVYDQDFAWPNSPSGSGKLRYSYLLPFGYDPVHYSYPIVMTGGGDRQSMEGPNGSYPTAGAQFVGNTLGKNYNTVAFRQAHPAIVISTECDQSAGSSAGPNGNCGGYADAPMSSWNEQAINGLLAWAVTNWSVTPGQHYCVGMSLSAIGCLAELVDNNSVNHMGSGLWDAGFLMSTQLTRPGVSNISLFPRMTNVPMLSVCSPGDNACNYDAPDCQYITGRTCNQTKTNYDSGGMAAIRAGTSQFYYISSTNGGTAYDTFGPMNADGGDGTVAYAWLFAQGAGPTVVPPPPKPTSGFHVANGKIVAPNGTNWIGIGVDIHDANLAASVSTILTQFKGANLVRVDTGGYEALPPPQTWAAAVTQLTNAGIVVEFTDYSNSLGTGGGGAQGSIFTGALLANELAWFKSMASYYKNNPYVWLGSNNEPPVTYPDGKIYTSGPNSLSAWQRASYDAVRSTGNTAPFLLEPAGSRAVNASFPWLLQSVMDPTQYTTMTNVVWDPHCYSYQGLNSTDPAAQALSVKQMVTQSQTIHSADGIPAVVIGEYSTWGAGGTQLVDAVLASGFSSGAWVMDASGVLGGPSGDPNATRDFALMSGGVLTSFGRTVAAAVANRTSPTPPVPPIVTPPVGPLPPASANNTTVLAGSTGTITDASGNVWSITSGGQVMENGTVIANTANVTELAYENSVVWQQNTSNNWYSFVPASGPTKTSPVPGAAPPLPGIDCAFTSPTTVTCTVVPAP